VKTNELTQRVRDWETKFAVEFGDRELEFISRR